MERLRTIAGTTHNSNIAKTLNVSPSTVTNWASRGVSKEGALKAGEVYGCDPNFILTGENPKPSVSDLKCSTDWLLTGKDEAKSQSGDLTYRDIPASSSSLIVLMDNLKDMETNGELSPQVIAAINGVIDAVRSASQATNSEAKKTQTIDFKALQTEAVTNHGKD